MTGRRRPGEHKQIASLDEGGYDLALDRRIRAQARLSGQSIGSCSPDVRIHWPADCYSYLARDRHKRIEQPLPTRYEIEAMQRVLAASMSNDALPRNIARSISSLATSLALDNLLRARRARPIGVEVAAALELIYSRFHKRLDATSLADTDIPY